MYARSMAWYSRRCCASSSADLRGSNLTSALDHMRLQCIFKVYSGYIQGPVVSFSGELDIVAEVND